MLGKKWHLFLRQIFFTMGLVVGVLIEALTERTFVIDIQDLLTTLLTCLSDMFCIFLDVEKKKLVECI